MTTNITTHPALYTFLCTFASHWIPLHFGLPDFPHTMRSAPHILHLPWWGICTQCSGVSLNNAPALSLPAMLSAFTQLSSDAVNCRPFIKTEMKKGCDISAEYYLHCHSHSCTVAVLSVWSSSSVQTAPARVSGKQMVMAVLQVCTECMYAEILLSLCCCYWTVHLSHLVKNGLT